MEKEEMAINKSFVFGALVLFFIVGIIFYFSSDNVRQTITGKATQPIDFNITLGAGGGSSPQIISVFNGSTIGGALTEGPSYSVFIVNISVNDVDGVSNLPTKAEVNFTKVGEDTRSNSTCRQYQSAGNNANYSCQIVMSWWDGDGTWIINGTIVDNNANTGRNDTRTFQVSATTGFVLAPGNLTFTGVTASGSNFTSNNDPLLLNNTGNQDIVQSGISINATNLVGESDSSKALYAGNFSVGATTGSNAECSAGTSTRMNYTVSGGSFVNITSAIMNASNFTINNGAEGQEQLYFCLRQTGSELIQQSYSTRSSGPWTVQILITLLVIRAIFKLRKHRKREISNNMDKRIFLGVLAIALIFIFASVASAFAVSMPSLPKDGEGNKIFYLMPKETRGFSFVLQNGGGATTDALIRAEVLEGNEIIKITDSSNLYNIPAGERAEVNVELSAPDDAEIGDDYKVALAFNAAGASGGGFNLGSSIQQQFKIIIGEDPAKKLTAKEEAVERPAISKEVAFVVAGIIILAFIIFFMRKRNKLKRGPQSSSVNFQAKK